MYTGFGLGRGWLQPFPKLHVSSPPELATNARLELSRFWFQGAGLAVVLALSKILRGDCGGQGEVEIILSLDSALCTKAFQRTEGEVRPFRAQSLDVKKRVLRSDAFYGLCG